MIETLEQNSHCREVIRKFDHDRYLSILYAPAEKRQALYGLYAFNYEISKIRETVSEPMLGEIRLQWWRESIDSIVEGNPRSHDIMPTLAQAICGYDISGEMLKDIIDGRAQELYDDSPKDLKDLEQYLGQTAGNLACLAGHILGGKDCDDLSRRLGIAWGYVGIIRSVSYNIALNKNFIPLDLMNEFEINEAKFLSPERPKNAKEIIRVLCQQAEDHLNDIREHKGRLNPDCRSAFLLSSLARSYLKMIRKADYNPFRLAEEKGAFFRQGRLLISALFNRI